MITNKLLHFKTFSAFRELLEAGNIRNEAIALIKDIKLIYSHGLFYCTNLTSIEQTLSSDESEGLNVYTMTFNNGETFDIVVKNGQQGNPGQSLEDVQVNVYEEGVSPEPYCEYSYTNGTLRINFYDTKGEKGDKGDLGDSAVYDPSSPDTPDFEMANTTGDSTTKAMTQKAVTDALDNLSTEAFENSIYSVTDITPASGSFTAISYYISPNTKKWVSATGSLADTFYFKSVTPGTIYKIQNPTQGNSQVVFLTSNSYSSGGTPDYAQGEEDHVAFVEQNTPYYRVAPVDAAYMYVRRKKSNTIVYTELGIVKTIKDSVTETKEDLKITDNKIEGYYKDTDINLTNLFEFTDGLYYYGTTSRVTTNSTVFSTSNAVDISTYQGRYLNITIPKYNMSSGSAPNAYLHFLDQDDNVISSVKVEAYSSSTNVKSKGNVAIYLIYIPKNADKVETNFYVSGSSFITIPFSCTIVDRVTGINEKIDSISAVTIKEGDQEDLTPIVTWTAAKGVYAAGNASLVDANVQSVTNMIDVSDYDSIRVTVNQRNLIPTVGCAFYNEDNQALVIYRGIYVKDSVDTLAMQTYKVPDNAKYFRTTVLTSLKNNFKIYGYKSKIANVSITDLKQKLFYPIIGSPRIYHSEDIPSDVTAFTSVDQVYEAWDALVTANPDWISRKEDIGMDQSETYAIRHYELGWQHRNVNTSRSRSGTNYWRDDRFKMRRILLNLGTHTNEDGALLAGYLSMKELLESNEEWAQFIKSNFIIDIIPILNPWGLDNKTNGRGVNHNCNDINLNRDFDADSPQSETLACMSLIQDLIPKGLVGSIDLHNTGVGEDSYLVSSSAYKLYPYYARLAVQLQGLMYDTLNSYFNSVGEHFHMWDVQMSAESDKIGQLHWYMDKIGLPGVTVEVSPTNSVEASKISKDYCINLIQTFGTMFCNI